MNEAYVYALTSLSVYPATVDRNLSYVLNNVLGKEVDLNSTDTKIFGLAPQKIVGAAGIALTATGGGAATYFLVSKDPLNVGLGALLASAPYLLLSMNAFAVTGISL